MHGHMCSEPAVGWPNATTPGRLACCLFVQMSDEEWEQYKSQQDDVQRKR